MTSNYGDLETDYGEALVAARRVKTALVLALMALVLIQVALFFVARHTHLLQEPLDLAGTDAAMHRKLATLARYATSAIDLLGIVVAIILAVVLQSITHIMLTARLPGVARLFRAFVWSVGLALLLFPWQSFFGGLRMDSTDLQIPGILYTWPELIASARFGIDSPVAFEVAFSKWARFAGFPFGAILIALTIQVLSTRGLRQAAGNPSVQKIDGQD